MMPLVNVRVPPASQRFHPGQAKLRFDPVVSQSIMNPMVTRGARTVTCAFAKAVLFPNLLSLFPAMIGGLVQATGTSAESRLVAAARLCRPIASKKQPRFSKYLGKAFSRRAISALLA